MLSFFLFFAGCTSSNIKTYNSTAEIGRNTHKKHSKKKKVGEKELVRELRKKIKARCVRVVNVREIVFDILGEKRSGYLLGIHGPMPSDTRLYVRKMGEHAAEILRKKIEKKEVYIEFDHGETPERTRWEVYVYLPGGDFVNGDLVLGGYARVNRKRPLRYSKDLLEMEAYARAHNRGFWKKVKEKNK